MTSPDERRALVVAAHPDDGDFGCAGYVMQLVAAGWRVGFLVCTNGAKGTADRSMDPKRLAAIRREEQREACRRMGVEDVFFLEHEDSELRYDRHFLGELVRMLRWYRPHTVLTHDPTDIIVRDSFINHVDHRTTGTAVLDAIYPSARDHLNFPEHLAEGLETHKVREVLLWGTNHPNFEVDITDVVERKIAALAAHTSQFADREDFIRYVRESWRGPDGRYREQFRRFELRF